MLWRRYLFIRVAKKKVLRYGLEKILTCFREEKGVRHHGIIDAVKEAPRRHSSI
jgi:hypothetical protein